MLHSMMMMTNKMKKMVRRLTHMIMDKMLPQITTITITMVKQQYDFIKFNMLQDENGKPIIVIYDSSSSNNDEADYHADDRTRTRTRSKENLVAIMHNDSNDYSMVTTTITTMERIGGGSETGSCHQCCQ